MKWTELVGIIKKYFKKSMTAIGIVDDKVEQLKKIGRFLSWWDCTNGLPLTEPPEIPYEYKTGDYFRVAIVGEINYKPDGTHYTGEPSTVIETNVVKRDYIYFYDGTAWTIIEVQGVQFEEIGGDPNDNPALFTELNKKFNIAQGTQHTGKAVMIDTDGNAVPTSLPPAPVTSVNGKAGAVVLDKTDIGLDKVVNTGDSATPTQGGTDKFTTGGAYNIARDVSFLRSDLTSETTSRETADTVLSNSLSLETNARKVEDNKLNQKITLESSTRLNADALLREDLDKETEARIAGDNTLDGKITSEAATRAAADEELSDRIDDIIAEGTSWSEVKDKPFSTIGTGLKVVSNSLQADIVDNLDSTDATKVLSAKQGSHMVDYVDASISDTLAYVDQQDASEHAGRVAGDNLRQLITDNNLQTTAKQIVPAINEVNAKTTGVFRPKGSVATYDDLPDDAEVGDVYNVLDTGMNYVWTVDEEWDALGGTVDLHEYRKAADQDEIDEGLSEAITAEATDRENQDQELANAITSEASVRAAADNNLNTTKQDKLVSGTNIKTINEQSVLGSGNIEIEGAIYTGSESIDVNAETNVISLKDDGVKWNHLATGVTSEIILRQKQHDEDLHTDNKYIVPAINQLADFIYGKGQPTYLQSDGNAYILTGITDYAGLSMELDVEWTKSLTGANHMLIGARKTSTDINFATGPVGTAFVAQLGGTSVSAFPADTERHIVRLDAANKEFSVDSNYTTITGATSTLPNDINCPLFGISYSGSVTVHKDVKIYSAKFRRNGAPILQLFPYYDIETNKFCMKDKLTGTLYHNAGSGNFTGDSSVTLESLLNEKQDKLVSGTNIKSINNQSLLGSGNLAITKNDVSLGNVVNTGDSATPVSGGTTKFTTGGAYTELAKKQNTLVSGTNIKTINGSNILGSGNLEVTINPQVVTGWTINTTVAPRGEAFAYRIGNMIFMTFNLCMDYSSSSSSFLKIINGLPQIKNGAIFTGVLACPAGYLTIAADGKNGSTYNTSLRTDTISTIPYGWYYGSIWYIAN